jgi:hypothetical protein
LIDKNNARVVALQPKLDSNTISKFNIQHPFFSPTSIQSNTMLASHRPDSITLDRLTPSVISNETNSSDGSKINDSTSYRQNTDIPDEVMFNDPDCVLISDNMKKTFMFATDIASSSPTSPQPVSTTEHASVWYTTKELTEIVQQATFALQVAQLSETLLTNENESFRGLEDSLSILAGQESKARKIGVAQAVFHEQKRQRTTGVLDTSRMRMMSNKVSRKSKSLALERAEQDAKAVLEREVPASSMLTGKGKGLQNYMPPRKNTRTNSLRQISTSDDKRPNTRTNSLRRLPSFEEKRLNTRTNSVRRLSGFETNRSADLSFRGANDSKPTAIRE